jgi:hypothetical protein
MNKILQALQLTSFGSRDVPLFPLIEELEFQRAHYANRKREIQEVVEILNLRVQAESTYAQSLYKIADRNPHDCIKIGILGKEVEALKQDCLSKSKAAEELADNVAVDCV